MKHVNKTVLLNYSPREMYDLVVNVADYPKFLPWCDRAEVLETRPDGLTAKLGLSFAGVRQSFTTRNTNVPGERMLMSLVDGPFSQLDGDWHFLPLGPAPEPMACKIEFSLNYAFASLPLEIVISPMFDRIASTLVDSFVKRAEQVYGSR